MEWIIFTAVVAYLVILIARWLRRKRISRWEIGLVSALGAITVIVSLVYLRNRDIAVSGVLLTIKPWLVFWPRSRA